MFNNKKGTLNMEIVHHLPTPGVLPLPVVSDTKSENQVPRYEPLFDDNDQSDIAAPAANTMDVTRMVYAIRSLERRMEQYALQERESREFYNRKKKQCEERVDMVKRSILGFLDQQSLKNLATPAGTAYTNATPLKEWPSDELLLAWARIHCPEAVRTKHEPDRRAISTHIAKTGEVPDGYCESTETRLYIR